MLINLRRIVPDLQMTLMLPPGLDHADELPDGIKVVNASGSRPNFGKVWFEQRTFPKMTGQVGADITIISSAPTVIV